LQSSVAEGRVGHAITLADAQELRPLADQAIVQMCGDPSVADGAFLLARDRFRRRNSGRVCTPCARASLARFSSFLSNLSVSPGSQSSRPKVFPVVTRKGTAGGGRF